MSQRGSEALQKCLVGGVFIAAALFTIYSAREMSGGMAMPGGWTMGMTWMRMPGQGWALTSLMFAGMWLAMMVAMMLPSMWPMLSLYRRGVLFRGGRGAAFLPWLMAATYFLVWTAFGIVAWLVGLAVANAAMSSAPVSRSIPFLAGAGLIVSGLYQLMPSKAACLRHCREPLNLLSTHLGRGWRGAVGLGVHHGAFCVACCWALMVMQLIFGVMNIAAMVAIACVIAAEKLLPSHRAGLVVARIVGAASAVAGVVMIVTALDAAR